MPRPWVMVSTSCASLRCALKSGLGHVRHGDARWTLRAVTAPLGPVTRGTAQAPQGCHRAARRLGAGARAFALPFGRHGGRRLMVLGLPLSQFPVRSPQAAARLRPARRTPTPTP